MTNDADEFETRLAERARRRWTEATTEFVDAAAREDQPELDERLVDDVLARLDGPEVAPAEFAPAELAPVATPPRSSRRALVLAFAALAAVALVWIAIPRRTPAWPTYEAVLVEGGIAQARGSDAAPERMILQPDSHLRWSFAPSTATDRAMDLRVAATGSDQRCLAPPERIASTGAIELAGSADAVLGLPPGPWHVRVLIGPAEHLAEVADPCRPDPDRGIAEVLRLDLEIRPSSP